MAQARTDLEQFFHPDGVVIVGRVDRNADPEALRAQYEERYGTRFYLVNPRGGSVGDIPIYESVRDLPEPVGLAVLSTPPSATAAVIDDCAARGGPYALVFSSGFSEVGGLGVELERDLAEAARRNNVRVFGPNTNTNAFERMPEVPNLRGGKIGLLTQSGHNGRPVVQGSLFGVGFSRWVPTGNEADLEVADFLEYFAYDDDTAVIAGYIEGFHSTEKLRRALQAANDNNKPVVMLKIGTTEAGSRMASSHTGHLTGSDAIIEGLFAQHGVTRVRDLDELLDTAALFAKLPAGTGTGVCLYSISGGSGTLMAENAEMYGIPIPTLLQETQDALHEYIPAYLTCANPVDNGGQFMSAPQEHRLKVLELIAADPAVDVIVIGITGALAGMTDAFGDDIKAIIDRLPVPLIVTWNSYKTDERGFQDLVDAGVPLFRSFRNCFQALRSFYDYQVRAKTFRHRPEIDATLPAAVADALARPGTLDADAARVVLEAFDVPLVKERVVSSADEARATATEFGLPVVMKIASADFPHKSDAGLVRLGVASADDAAAVHDDLMARAREVDPNARVDGVLIQQQVDEGVEMIVGATYDPVLGPAVMVGTGGVYAELLRDTAVRPLPIDETDAREMVESLRGAAILHGARGRPAADIDALVQTILAVAKLASAAGPRLSELDLNPVIVDEKGAVAVDTLVVAGEAGG